MRATVITIGDELLIGQVVNSNAAWIGEQLTSIGVTVREMLTVGDDEDQIRAALERTVAENDLVVVTGGLGPTHDDITKTVVSEYFGTELRFEKSIFEEIKKRFDARGIPLAVTNRGQAMVPEGFDVLENPIGTAPGLWYSIPLDDNRQKRIVLLPGVPPEMKLILANEVIPRLKNSGDTGHIVQKTLLSTGIGESNLNELIGDLSSFLDENLKLAFLPGLQGVRMRLTGYLGRDESVSDRMSLLESFLRQQTGPYLFGEGNDTLESVVGHLLGLNGKRIVVAESCTGGLVASRLTDVPGSSDYMIGGIVAYDDRIKIEALGVDPENLKSFGAVSRQVAVQMAEGVRAQFGSDIGVSTTGIMGPGGGSEDKPVGTVWIAHTDKGGSTASKLLLGKGRKRNKERTVTAVLNMIRIQIQKSLVPEVDPS